jgi:hypothetical protein
MAKLVASFDYSAAELLALVNEAIAKLVAGAEEVQIGSTRYRKTQLEDLYSIRESLKQEVSNDEGIAVNKVRFVRR